MVGNTGFPNEQAALQRVCMAIMSLDPTGTEQRLDDALEAGVAGLRHGLDGQLSAGRK